MSLRDQDRMASRYFGGENVLTFSGEVPTKLEGGREDVLIWM